MRQRRQLLSRVYSSPQLSVEEQCAPGDASTHREPRRVQTCCNGRPGRNVRDHQQAFEGANHTWFRTHNSTCKRRDSSGDASRHHESRRPSLLRCMARVRFTLQTPVTNCKPLKRLTTRGSELNLLPAADDLEQRHAALLQNQHQGDRVNGCWHVPLLLDGAHRGRHVRLLHHLLHPGDGPEPASKRGLRPSSASGTPTQTQRTL